MIFLFSSFAFWDYARISDDATLIGKVPIGHYVLGVLAATAQQLPSPSPVQCSSPIAKVTIEFRIFPIEVNSCSCC